MATRKSSRSSSSPSRSSSSPTWRRVWDVQPHRKKGDWEVQREGGIRATSVHATKAEATQEATRLGRAAEKRGQKAEVRVKDSRGRIQQERTYGRDPRRTKG